MINYISILSCHSAEISISFLSNHLEDIYIIELFYLVINIPSNSSQFYSIVI